MEKGYWFQPIRQAQAHLPLGEQSQLDSAGQNLVRFLFTLQNNNPDEYARIMKEFLKIVPEMQKVSARLSGADAIVTMDENSLSSLRDLDNVSSGLMQTLILVAGILSIKSESLFLIEEPEIHLHANSQRRLFDLIRREAKNRQFFITTHSTIFSACEQAHISLLSETALQM
jgi:predicted ATPase